MTEQGNILSIGRCFFKLHRDCHREKVVLSPIHSCFIDPMVDPMEDPMVDPMEDPMVDTRNS